MLKSQWASLVAWVVVIFIIILMTLFYQPTAAETGHLLVWLDDHVSIMDIDQLLLQPVGPTANHQAISPSPGCQYALDLPCWVVIDDNIYRLKRNGQPSPKQSLLINENSSQPANHQWLDSAVSWSPDGVHVTYGVLNRATEQTELWLYNAATGDLATVGSQVDPTIAVAWTPDCAAGWVAECELAYKTVITETGQSPNLVAWNRATNTRRQWQISAEPIFELRWSPANILLYSRPKRYFYRVTDHQPAFDIPPGAKIANVSPEATYAVYYQSFELADCDSNSPSDEPCLFVGVWLTEWERQQVLQEPKLIYNYQPSKASEVLNFIPVWSPSGEAFVFFQEGQLIYYDLLKKEAAIYTKSLHGKIRSEPVFAPDKAAVAFVDNQGYGLSEYRLLVIDPRLRPIEHVVVVETGFKILAWLPD